MIEDLLGEQSSPICPDHLEKGSSPMGPPDCVMRSIDQAGVLLQL
jgi:hypothetical protein